MDAVNCSCVVSAHFGSHRVHLVVKFPAQYPNNAAPTFQFVSPTTISSAMKTKIQKVRKCTVMCCSTQFGPETRLVVSSSDSDGHVSSEGEAESELSGTVCPTAGFLSGVRHGEVAIVMTSFPPRGSGCVFMLLLFQTQEEGPTSGPFILSNPVTPALQAFPRVTNTYGSYQVTNARASPGPSHTLTRRQNSKLCLFSQDANIPFPRTSGARFCGTGCLVYFTRPITMHRSAPPTEPTPR